MYNSKNYKSTKAKASTQKELDPKHVLDVLNFYGDRLGIGSFSERDAKAALKHDASDVGYGGWDDKEREVCYNVSNELFCRCFSYKKYFDRDHYDSLRLKNPSFESKKAKEYSKSVDDNIRKALPSEDELYRALFRKKPSWYPDWYNDLWK